jgi:hypothetical protein
VQISDLTLGNEAMMSLYHSLRNHFRNKGKLQTQVKDYIEECEFIEKESKKIEKVQDKSPQQQTSRGSSVDQPTRASTRTNAP